MPGLMEILNGGGNLNQQQGYSAGKALFANTQDAATRGQENAAKLAIQLANAQKVTDENMARDAAESAAVAAGLDPIIAHNVITQQRAGFDPTKLSGYTGKMQEQGFRGNSVAEALAGNWAGANANLMGVANGPVELASVQGQNLINNRLLPGGGGISTTEQGMAGIQANQARAGASNAQAQAALGRLGIAQQQFALQRNGQWNPGGNAGVKSGGVTAGKPLTPAQVIAQQKAQQAGDTRDAQLGNVNRGIKRIQSALDALGGSFVDTGPVDQYLVRHTPSGQELDAAVGAIQNSMLALTRVPGVGSQSDLEARIAAMQYPSLANAPSVNANSMKQLQDFVADLQARAAQAQQGSLNETLQGGVPSRPQPNVGAAPVQRARNPATGQTLILVNGQWVPE